LLAKAREATGLGIITEVMDTADLEKDMQTVAKFLNLR
jgi:3-deoxy-D-arabino-heptulosonate 7-phosphate (DAHP) synthase